MGKSDVKGAGCIAAGGYVGYKGVEHGLPRVFGIRTEYHTTSKENAELIKKAGNILDPKFGGKNGWGKKVECEHFLRNSKNYVHITGIHEQEKHLPVPKKFVDFIRAPHRKFSCIMYKFVGNNDMESLVNTSPKEAPKKILKTMFSNIFKPNQTKRFCIPGIDSYFNKEFIPDTDDIALKSSKPIKAFNNRLSAMFEGIKKFGLQGMKENKGRVAAGIGLTSLAAFLSYKLISCGVKNIKA